HQDTALHRRLARRLRDELGERWWAAVGGALRQALPLASDTGTGGLAELRRPAALVAPGEELLGLGAQQPVDPEQCARSRRVEDDVGPAVAGWGRGRPGRHR